MMQYIMSPISIFYKLCFYIYHTQYLTTVVIITIIIFLIIFIFRTIIITVAQSIQDTFTSLHYSTTSYAVFNIISLRL